MVGGYRDLLVLHVSKDDKLSLVHSAKFEDKKIVYAVLTCVANDVISFICSIMPVAANANGGRAWLPLDQLTF